MVIGVSAPRKNCSNPFSYAESPNLSASLAPVRGMSVIVFSYSYEYYIGFMYKFYSTSVVMSFFKNEYIFSPCNGILSFDQHVEKSLYTIRSLRLSIVPLTLLK